MTAAVVCSVSLFTCLVQRGCNIVVAFVLGDKNKVPGTASTAHSEVPLVLCLLLSYTRLVERQLADEGKRGFKSDLWKNFGFLVSEGKGGKKCAGQKWVNMQKTFGL